MRSLLELESKCEKALWDELEKYDRRGYEAAKEVPQNRIIKLLVESYGQVLVEKILAYRKYNEIESDAATIYRAIKETLLKTYGLDGITYLKVQKTLRNTGTRNVRFHTKVHIIGYLLKIHPEAVRLNMPELIYAKARVKFIDLLKNLDKMKG
jgi:hypothetical protein